MRMSIFIAAFLGAMAGSIIGLIAAGFLFNWIVTRLENE